MARRCTVKQWNEIVQGVRAVAPLPRDYDVTVVRAPLQEAFGWAESMSEVLDSTGRFKITIDDDLTAPHTADILIHEFAHILDWRPTTAVMSNHGPTFWVTFGELWRAYYQVM